MTSFTPGQFYFKDEAVVRAFSRSHCRRCDCVDLPLGLLCARWYNHGYVDRRHVLVQPGTTGVLKEWRTVSHFPRSVQHDGSMVHVHHLVSDWANTS
ncbi:hypothetical protein MRX96_027169 [Rhipicephalus microplus]